MTKRLFIAIKLPAHTRNYLQEIRHKWNKLDVRWVPAENIHLTLFFLGATDIDVIPIISQCCRDAATKCSSIKIKIGNASLGPNSYNPRLIWASIERNEALENFWNNLSQCLQVSRIYYKNPERKFTPHLTLARFQRLPHKFSEQKSCSEFIADSFELIESVLKPAGVEYIVLESFKFQISDL